MPNMMSKKLTIGCLLGLLLLSTQCREDPDLVVKVDEYNTANYPANTDQLFNVLIPVYGNVRRNIYGRDLTAKLLYNLDHTSNLAFAGDISWIEAARNNLNTTNAYAADAWTGGYTGIKNANAFMDRLEFYQKTYAKPGEEATLNAMKGEAHFLRALHYFLLINLFGESYLRNGAGGDKMGVPIIRSVAGSLADTQVPRSTVGEVWSYIIADLEEAETLLAGKVWPAAERGRVNEWAVKTLLGKSYVFTEDWEQARTKLREVIDRGGKRLMPFPKYRNAFNGDPANEYNEESIFEINVERDLEFPTGDVRNQSTLIGLVIAPSYLGANGTEESAAALGFGNEFVHDKNLLRYGFKQPLWTLVDNPKYTGRNPSALNPARIIDPEYKKESLRLRTEKAVDPRLYVAALQPWVDSVSTDGGKTWVPVARYKEIPVAERRQYYGWSFHKFATLDYAVNGFYRRNDASNQYVLRLADVYLLYAEANARTGNDALALEYINKVKRRAYSYPVDAPSPVDYPSLTAPTNASDPVLGNNPLRYERWAELFGEAHWWFDVCRWRIGRQEADYYQTTVAGGNIQWDDNKSYVLPIPSTEINTNSAIAGQQNPGY